MRNSVYFSLFFYKYGQWLVDNTREQLDFIVLDRVWLSEKQTVVCDLHLAL